jgi:hypothetical protein
MKYLKLRENLGLRFTDENCEIHGPRGIKLLDLSAPQISLLKRLRSEGQELQSLMSLSAAERALLKTLSGKKLLRVFEDDYSRNEIWLSHYVEDARAALQSLGRKKVMIVGCGGTGAIVADHLARAGVRDFILVDGADLDEPDLNRQWTFSAQDCGQPKVELLAAHLFAHTGAVSKCHRLQIENTNTMEPLLAASCDLIVWCADKPQWTIEKLALDLADGLNTPILFGAVGIEDDYAGPVLRTADERAQERARLDALEELQLDSGIIRGSICFTNTIAAAKIGLLAFQHLIKI